MWWVGGVGLSSKVGRQGNATEPPREGGAHTTLGGGLYAVRPWGKGGGHSCVLQPVVPAR